MRRIAEGIAETPRRRFVTASTVAVGLMALDTRDRSANCHARAHRLLSPSNQCEQLLHSCRSKVGRPSAGVLLIDRVPNGRIRTAFEQQPRHLDMIGLCGQMPRRHALSVRGPRRTSLADLPRHHDRAAIAPRDQAAVPQACPDRSVDAVGVPRAHAAN